MMIIHFLQLVVFGYKKVIAEAIKCEFFLLYGNKHRVAEIWRVEVITAILTPEERMFSSIV